MLDGEWGGVGGNDGSGGGGVGAADGRLEPLDVAADGVKVELRQPLVVADEVLGVPLRLLEAAALGRLDLAYEGDGALGRDRRERDGREPERDL